MINFNSDNTKKALKQILLYGITTISALFLGLKLPDTETNICVENNPTINQNQQQAFTRAEYERLKTGMSLYEVESILGRGIEKSSSATMSVYIWQNLDESEIMIELENGKLFSKQQSGLK